MVVPYALGWKDVLMTAFEYVLENVKSPKKYPATFSDNDSRATVTPGSVQFNKGSNGVNMVDKKVYAQKAGHRIEMWANSQQLFYRGSIGVVLRKGSFKPINRTVGHNQYSTYKVGSGRTGNYIASFNSTSKHKWRIRIGYNHCGVKSYRALGDLDAPSVGSFVDVGDEKFLVPSDSFKRPKPALRALGGPEGEYDFSGLYEEFYGSELDSLVDVPKTLPVDSSVVVSNKISRVHYNAEEDATYFHFDNARVAVELPFAGNLTKRFAVGDRVKFKFQMNRVIDGYDFVTFDYTDSTSTEGVFPKIEQFIDG